MRRFRCDDFCREGGVGGDKHHDAARVGVLSVELFEHLGHNARDAGQRSRIFHQVSKRRMRNAGLVGHQRGPGVGVFESGVQGISPWVVLTTISLPFARCK